MNIRKNTIITLTILLVSVLNSCATSERMSLEERINALYQAEASENCKEWYEIIWTERRRGVSFDEFVTICNKRDFSIVSWKIKSIRTIDEWPYDEFSVDEAAAVSMDVVVEYSDGRRETATYQTDYWVKEKNEWYWNFRGWPDD